MLNPGEDRLDYGNILKPPKSYTLDFAVGTTYSLDLDALVGMCISLGLLEEADSNIMKDPICLLEALRRTGDKVALFCEAGEIYLPGKVSALYTLLEKMVFQVVTKARSGIKYPSFHPKFWLLRYINKEEVLYRVVVLSRNLTFDRSWDICFYMDGELGEETDKNIPVADFLKYLLKQLPKLEISKAKQIRQLIKELDYVNFETGMKEFYDFEFIPSGVPCSEGGIYSMLDTSLIKGENDRLEKSFHELLVISPFLSKDIVRQFNERSRWIENAEYMLITRQMSLDNLSPEDCDKFRIYVLKDEIVDGEAAISDGESDYYKQDIHAKIYMLRKNADTEVYLGSLNASHNAVYGNIEFMILLRSKNRYINLEKLKAEIFNGDEEGANNPFKEVELLNCREEKDIEESEELDFLIKQVNRYKFYAVVTENASYYDVNISVENYEKQDADITISPIFAQSKEAKFAKNILFEKLTINALSKFYVLSICDIVGNNVKRVIKIETEGMPNEREGKVISSIIGENFYRYIEFLFGDDHIISTLKANSEKTQGIAGKSYSTIENMPVLYEKMLKKAATEPESFTEIEKIIRLLPEDGVVPEAFKKLYSTFRKVVK
ncbi:phospholipase D family protein [Lachnoanaerobaculum gingivalis]|uniref:phospholipase D family protein n=1 Tax=Lachnoanaerobaculum gingivalis TaxID=2490855 RepID=UPI0028D1D109|nr:phospholipase D family protein [Lachnoanaerobaculum gingivalis]